MSKKRGPLSAEEKNFITRNAIEMTTDEIAEALQRNEKTVSEYISKNQLVPVTDDWEIQQQTRLRQTLHERPYWPEVVKQLSATEDNNEAQYFEENWIRYMLQFREDVLYSEEMQIKQLIILDILMNRSMQERKRHQEEADRIQALVDIEYNLPEEARDKALIANLETQVSYARNSITNYTTEHTKLLNEMKFITKTLKANRDERIKRIEDGKGSWTGVLRMLEDEQERERVGREAELMRKAMFKSRDKLSELHTYEDDRVDQPLLTPETYKPELYEETNNE